MLLGLLDGAECRRWDERIEILEEPVGAQHANETCDLDGFAVFQSDKCALGNARLDRERILRLITIEAIPGKAVAQLDHDRIIGAVLPDIHKVPVLSH